MHTFISIYRANPYRTPRQEYREGAAATVTPPRYLPSPQTPQLLPPPPPSYTTPPPPPPPRSRPRRRSTQPRPAAG